MGFLLVGVLIAAPPGLSAQPAKPIPEFHVDTWRTDDGLPQDFVTAVLQTRQGYLWVGTYEGLARFDGLRFKTFDPEDTPGLGSSRITCLFEDQAEVLWIGTDGGGLTRYRDGQFTRFTTKNGLVDDRVTSLCEDRAGALWIGTQRGGLHRLKEGKITAFGELHGLSPGGPVTLAQDEGGRLWVAVGGEIGMFRDEAFNAVHRDPGRPFDLLGSEDGGLWVVEGPHLYKYIGGRLRTMTVPLAVREGGVSIRAIYEDSKGRLWIGTAGLGLFWRQEGGITKAPVRAALAHQIILCVTEDRQGNIWVGTDGNGLHRLKPASFEVYNARTGLADNNVLSACEDKAGGIWIATSAGGVHRIHEGRIQRFTRRDGLEYDGASAVLEDRQGQIWVATWGGGVYRAPNPEGKFVPLGTKDGLSSDVVRSLYEDRDGTLWLGTYGGGVSAYRDGQFRNYTTREGLAHNDVRVIHQDRKGHLWFGTGGGGLSRLADGKFTSFTRREGLAGEFVRCMYEDSNGVLWIGTGAGLSRLQDGRLVNITADEGLADESVNQILEDHRGQFWIGSSKGIFRVARQELEDQAAGRIRQVRCVSYGSTEGIGRCNGGYQPGAWRTRTGKLLFPMATGLAIVEPDRVKTNPAPPPVVIEELVIDEQVFGPGRKVVAPAGSQRVEFRFTGLDLGAPSRIRFKYRLEGFDRDWLDAGPERVAYYTRLPPGTYRFQVIAANKDGVWNTTGSSWPITVVPPVWQTGWFRALVALAAIALIAGLVRYISVKRMQTRLAVLEQQNALERERARIAQDMHDDIGASLTQIAYLSDLGQSAANAPPPVAEQLRKISTTAREVVRSLDEIVWAINPRNDTLDHLVDYLCQYADDYLDSAGIRCWQDAPTNLPDRRVSAEVRHNVFLVVKEALNNIVKHARVAEVWLRVGWDGARLEVSLTDKGKGFQPEKVRAGGSGLENMRRRIAECRGAFDLRTRPGEGTRVTFTLPL